MNELSGHILSVAVPKPLDGLFTYRLPEALLASVQIGGWVRVPFGRTVTHAFVVEAPKPISELDPSLDPKSLKEVMEVGEGGVLPEDVFQLCRWAHEYYAAPFGEVLHCAAPPAALGLKSAKREARPWKISAQAVQGHPLTEEQIAAVQGFDELRLKGETATKVALLDGVTGSGKTEVYLELARRVLSEGKGVILLVPEIALTSQLHRRLEESLGTAVGLWHSAIADGKRRDLTAALAASDLKVIVGARSAVFAPVRNLGLIVIDEEHDPTYKQEDRVRYHARDLAVVRAKITGALVILGSATPSLESRERVREGRYAVAHLKNRIAAGGLPKVELVDLCTQDRVSNTQAPLATRTIEALQQTIDAGDQAMVFLNRRGFAAFLVCQDCGEVSGCPQCSISLTVHRKFQQLRCHVCGHREPIPDLCQKCQSLNLEAVGAGTESLELELPKLLKGIKPLRLDRDQITSTKRLESVLDEFRSGKANVLLGTQMLVKGHDFPGVTLVVVILADALFRWPDFRGPERALQILKQVSGRAGRGQRPGKVLIQTFDTDHPVIQVTQGILSEDEFLNGERELRLALGYPPFGRLARIRLESSSQDEARIRSRQVFDSVSALHLELELLGPSEAFLERAKGIYRWDILVKARDIQLLRKAVFSAKDACSRNKWPVLVDIDPYGSG